MHTSLLSAKQDPMGQAIADHQQHRPTGRLRVFSPQFDEDEIPVSTLFRTFKQMPPLEQEALRLACGKILDVGAGSGCHSLALQQMEKTVTAIDISPLSVEVMRQRGVHQVEHTNFFAPTLTGPFHTVLMLMNGIGIVGTIQRLPQFFNRLRQLLEPDGYALIDSTDLRYIFENEDGSLDIDLAGNYYGEVEFSMQYRQVKGPSFHWLYIDFSTLQHHALLNGFQAELVCQGKHYDYLARLTPIGVTPCPTNSSPTCDKY